MNARVSEPLTASPFFYGPPDRRRGKAGRSQSHLPSPLPERQPQPAQAWAGSVVRGTSYATSVEVGIPSEEPASYRGHLARDIRATVEASRTGRPPREGARTMKGTTRTFVITLAMATILATVATGAAVAAKGGGKGHQGGGTTSGGGGTITLVMAKDANGDGLPNWGDWVTFNISTTATDQPWVNLRCFQNGALVAQGWDGFFDGSLTGRTFGLYSGVWKGGAADCTAYLETPQWSVLASTSFHVNA